MNHQVISKVTKVLLTAIGSPEALWNSRRYNKATACNGRTFVSRYDDPA